MSDDLARSAANASEQAEDVAVSQATTTLPLAAGFRLVRYFMLASLPAILLVAAALLYFSHNESNFFTQAQQEQGAFFKQEQDSFAQWQDETARHHLLRVQEAGNVNVTQLFANTLWEKDFAPFVAKVRRIPVDRCRAIADVRDASGRNVQPNEKKTCFAGIGKQIMALPEFQALNAKVFETMKKSSVFKIKVYDLRGITVYSSEHNQIGEDKIGNAGWQIAVAGKPASELTHREKFSAFEGVVEDRDLISSYLPVRASGSETIVGVFEVYSDVTPFVKQIDAASVQIGKRGAANRAKVEQAAAVNQGKTEERWKQQSAIVLVLLALLYLALLQVVHHGQRTIDKEEVKLKQAESALSRLNRVLAVLSGVSSAIVRIRNRQELFEEACRIAVEHGKFGLAWIGLYNPATLEVTPVASAGLGSDEMRQSKATARADVPQGQGVLGRAIRESRPVFDNDISVEKGVGGRRRQEALRLGYRSLIVLPLFAEGAVAGMLALFAREPDFFDEEEIKLLTELAGDISFALQAIEKGEKLEYLSYYDALTGLPNRQLFVDRLSRQMRSRSDEPRMVALILLDIERLRNINEMLGRHGGDEMLRLIARRLEHAFSGPDYIARIGADGFGAVIRGVRDAMEVVHAIENQVLACFREPFLVNDKELRVAAKTGIAVFPADGGDADTLFKNAEAALRKAKDTGERFLFYTSEMNARAAQSLSLETRLRKAAEAQQFVLHYQPKVELASGRVSGLEALIRWNDPEKGLVPPGSFIPLLEETGLILEVGRWALAQTLAQHCEWTSRGLTVPRIAVNVSAIQLQQKDYADMVSETVRRGGNVPEAIELEITESLLMKDIEASIRKLVIVRELGIHIAMDDFGTGHSSLSYLARLPINSLKIDRSFINGMAGGGDNATIVSTIITLAHSLNLRVVAEGVETKEQAQLLRLLKCDEMQGYLFSRPLPAAEVETRFLSAPAA